MFQRRWTGRQGEPMTMKAATYNQQQESKEKNVQGKRRLQDHRVGRLALLEPGASFPCRRPFLPCRENRLAPSPRRQSVSPASHAIPSSTPSPFSYNFKIYKMREIFLQECSVTCELHRSRPSELAAARLKAEPAPP